MMLSGTAEMSVWPVGSWILSCRRGEEELDAFRKPGVLKSGVCIQVRTITAFGNFFWCTQGHSSTLLTATTGWKTSFRTISGPEGAFLDEMLDPNLNKQKIIAESFPFPFVTLIFETFLCTRCTDQKLPKAVIVRTWITTPLKSSFIKNTHLGGLDD